MEEWHTTRKTEEMSSFTDMELLENEEMQFCEGNEGTAKWTDESQEERSVHEWIQRKEWQQRGDIDPAGER